MQDKISKPVRGRFFPIKATEIIHLMAEQGFNVHYDKRLPLRLENCNFECELGLQLASFNRMGYLAIFSLPDSTNKKTAELALKRTIESFGHIDKGPHLGNAQKITPRWLSGVEASGTGVRFDSAQRTA